MHWITLSHVALGGAIGASCRYLTGIGTLRLFGPGFPHGTLTVNIVGSFIMGFIVVYLERKNGTHLAPFLMTGILGGFTTFSAFSLDTIFLIEKGQIGTAALYAGASFACALLALVVGLWAARAMVVMP
ncbi:fluoride efflux transporter CrcB [Tropicimonas sp. TH_r6]|uniref:fluoride efflux transporter CrcB n=1 Tax=Tropicimonas sp. TH_r6 TaxID=3082085 RepID=UPI002954D7BB|nr:fluoride efflux transporter CrcB [Tropicimonas sp. TH_r6]MDV7142264.1 fluoride efflux transporter CrcB [Tropicimonas sp. TH_r6]